MFVPSVPSERVLGFLKEHPQVSWQESLEFLLDYWQQVVEGRVQYLVEGGVAVKLLYPQRQEPNDVDVVTRSINMAGEFNGARRIDVKPVSFWYASRLLPDNGNAFDPTNGAFLLDMSQEVQFGQRSLFILNPVALAVSKTLRYHNRDPREKDLEDLRLLDQDPQKVQNVIDRIKASYHVSESRKL